MSETPKNKAGTLYLVPAPLDFGCDSQTALTEVLPEGTLRGHAFHYSKTEAALAPIATSMRPDGRVGEAIYRRQRLTASYMHLYFPSNPEAVAHLFSR